MFNPIHGWEDTHLINKHGEVIVKERLILRKDGRTSRLKKHPLKWNLQKGYPTVALYVNGRMKRYFIHRLLYETYVEKIPEGMQINHINGIKDDNRIENLELVTPKENTQHAWRTGLSKKQLGEKCSTSKLNNGDIRKIRRLSNEGLGQGEIAKMFNLHQTNIHYILIGKTWSHVT